ncbi:MAG: theronine dehydrogenase [Rhizobiaceae bacterium]|nr:theronine dehydrogenase [Rhizobiaceae bacterium]
MNAALWTYSLRWSLPHLSPPGPRELARADVPAGRPCPDSVMALWKPGAGYAICIDFPPPAPIKRWSDERKAAARRRNLERRVRRLAPLFADEFIAREIAARPAYFQGKSPI